MRATIGDRHRSNSARPFACRSGACSAVNAGELASSQDEGNWLVNTIGGRQTTWRRDDPAAARGPPYCAADPAPRHGATMHGVAAAADRNRAGKGQYGAGVEPGIADVCRAGRESPGNFACWKSILSDVWGGTPNKWNGSWICWGSRKRPARTGLPAPGRRGRGRERTKMALTEERDVNSYNFGGIICTAAVRLPLITASAMSGR